MIAALRREHPEIPDAVLRKAALLFSGVRYTDALAEAAAGGAAHNFWPYKRRGEGGATRIAVPYLFALPDGGVARVRLREDSPLSVLRQGDGFAVMEGERPVLPIGFVPRHAWQARAQSDWALGAAASVEQLGDMIVVNVAPGCEYFRAESPGGAAARCTFCAYGRFDRRAVDLGQVPGRTAVEPRTLDRLAQVLALAAPEASHVYLTGGSLLDPAEEARRYVSILRTVRAAVGEGVQVTCGSGAVSPAAARRYREAGADSVCFNLEVWDAEVFAACCPGKATYVGREKWIDWLHAAVDVFGRGRVASALGFVRAPRPPAPPRTVDQARASALEGARALMDRGVATLFSPLWPVDGTAYRPDDGPPLGAYLRLEAALAEERARRGFPMPSWLVCRRCSYMLLEVDFDHARGLTCASPC